MRTVWAVAGAGLLLVAGGCGPCDPRRTPDNTATRYGERLASDVEKAKAAAELANRTAAEKQKQYQSALGATE